MVEFCRFLILLLQIARRHIRTRDDELNREKPGDNFDGGNKIPDNYPSRVIGGV